MEMSINRALAEIKKIKQRLEKNFCTDIDFVTIKKNGDTVINGIPEEEFKKRLVSNFDQVNSLISRMEKLKSAIMTANHLTNVTICGKEMTITEALAAKEINAYKKNFLSILSDQYNARVKRLNTYNEKADGNLADYLEKVLQTNKTKADASEVQSITEIFEKKHKYIMFDPNKVQDFLTKQRNILDNFEAEVDGILTEKNAITMITIED